MIALNMHFVCFKAAHFVVLCSILFFLGGRLAQFSDITFLQNYNRGKIISKKKGKRLRNNRINQIILSKSINFNVEL